MTRSFAHLVNPVAGAPGDLGAAMPVTFESMRRAREAAEGVARVELWSAGYPGDGAAPDGFAAARPLEHSVLDHGSFAVPRKLPLIGELLSRLYESSSADWLVYTNVDIGLRREFYLTTAQLAERHDAFSIHRRTVRCSAAQATDLEWLSTQAGEPHPGHDCFVFRRELLAGFDFGAVCIGFPPVGMVLLAALSTLAERFAQCTDLFVTFHANDDRQWCDPRFNDYWQHNRGEALAVLARLERLRPLSPLAREVAATIAGYQGFERPAR